MVDKKLKLLTRTKDDFGQFALDETLVSINEACSRWSHGELKDFIGILKGQEPGNSKFHWVAAETARHALLWCMYRSADSKILIPHSVPSESGLRHLMELAVAIQSELPYTRTDSHLNKLKSSKPVDTGSWLWLPQYTMERSSPWRVGRALLLYGTVPELMNKRKKGFAAEFTEFLKTNLGSPLESFLSSVVLLCGISSSTQPRIGVRRAEPVTFIKLDELFYKELPGGLLKPSIYATINILAANPKQAINYTTSNCAVEVEEGYRVIEGPNPLIRHPLIFPFRDNREYCIAPVPNLIHEWLYEPLMDFLFSACTTTKAKDNLANIFELYVGYLGEICSPDNTPWIPEEELRVGYSGKVVDWIREFSNTYILIDAKLCFVSDQSKYEAGGSSWKRVHKTIEYGVLQCYEFWQSIKEGKASRISYTLPKNAIGIVVTHFDTEHRSSHWQTRNDINEALRLDDDSFHWLALSLDRFEKVMTAWSLSQEVNWLAGILEEACLSDKPGRILSEIQAKPEGPLWKVYNDLTSTIIGLCND